MPKQPEFFNPYQKEVRRTFWDVLLWKFGHYKDKVASLPMPATFTYPVPQENFDPSKPKVLWVNHSTFFVSVEGINILTDPIWNHRCFPLLGPKRHHNPGVTLSSLPEIHYVLISHDHYDHLDRATVLQLHHKYPEITWLVPLGVKAWFTKLGISNIVECCWWQEVTLTPKTNQGMALKITCVPAQHFSGRKLNNVNTTLWCGWVVECMKKNDLFKRFYFVGDTGYNTHDFRKIGERWGSMDLSLVPIGSYVPRAFMAPVHVEPADAVHIHQDVGSKRSLAGHWKTFRLSDEPMHRPPYDLFLALEDKKIDPSKFLVLEPGYEVNW
jgi:N-acyl-phosphatidylethanolamine-hydrolysing phospholipase D